MSIAKRALLARAGKVCAEDDVLLIQLGQQGYTVGQQGYTVWHKRGQTQLSEAQLTEIYLSALPGGGPRLSIGEWQAKAFSRSARCDGDAVEKGRALEMNPHPTHRPAT